MAFSREFALCFLVSLFAYFDHFIVVFDYSVGRSLLSCNHGFMDSNEELFFFKNNGTFKNVCCNIRNAKSNNLKCIASQCLSPPCVLFFVICFSTGH